MVVLKIHVARHARAVWVWGGGVGCGGIIINVVFALNGVTRCGCFEDPCSTSRARCVGWWGGGVVGWGGIIINVVVALKCVTRCGCFEDPCSTSRARCVGVGWGGGVGWGNY